MESTKWARYASKCIWAVRSWRWCTKIESTVPHGGLPVASQKLHTSLLQGQRRVKPLCRSSMTGCVCARLCTCVCVCVCWGYRKCLWGVPNNPPLLKVLSGSRIKPLTWKHCLIYSNSWEVLSAVPVSNERGRTNSWQGIFLLNGSAYNYTLTNGV